MQQRPSGRPRQPSLSRRRCPRRGYQPFADSATPADLVQLMLQWLDTRSRAAVAATSRRMLHHAQQSYRWPGTPLIQLRHSQWAHSSAHSRRPHSVLSLAPVSLHLQLYHRTLDVAALVSHIRMGVLSHLQLAIRTDPRLGQLRPPSARQLRRMLKAAPRLTISILVLQSGRQLTDQAAEQLAALERVSERVCVVHSHVYQQA